MLAPTPATTTPNLNPEISPARLAANRANAQKSTGPRTPEGKARSRANAYRHGLAGEGVVLPDDQLEAVAAVAAEIADELRPHGPMGRILTHRVAALTVRLDRCSDHDAAMTAFRVRHAEERFLDDRAAEVDRALDRLALEPAASVRALRRSFDGINRLIELWEAVGTALFPESLAELARVALSPAATDEPPPPDPARWDDRFLHLAENLQGRRVGDLAPSRFHHLAGLAARGTTAEARQKALEAIADLIIRQVADLKAHRAAFDHRTDALDAAEAPRRALFDPDRAAVLARRYEAAAERALTRTLREIRELAQAAPEPAPLPIPAPRPPAPVAAPLRPDRDPAHPRTESLGSFRQLDSGSDPDVNSSASRRNL